MLNKLNEYPEWYRTWYNGCIEKNMKQHGIPKEYFIVKQSSSTDALNLLYTNNVK